MTKVPFLVICTSCESILEVRNPELIGQIVACPKCGSMVLIEQTDQVRQSPEESVPSPPVTQLPDIALSEELSNFTIPFQIPDTPVSQDKLTDGFVCKEQFGEVAAELHAKFLSNATFDIWQKRRLIIIAVGTICLLTAFAMFLLHRPLPDDMVSTGMKPGNPENQNNWPELPVGIEATQTGEQLHHQASVPSEGQNGSPLLPSVENIQVEGQFEEEEAGFPPDTTIDPDDDIAIQPVKSTQPESSSNSDRQVTAIKVPTPLTESLTDDPFDDLDNISVDNDQIEWNTGNRDGGGFDITLDKQPVESDGFAGFFEDTLSTDTSEQKSVPEETTSPAISETPEQEDVDKQVTVDTREIDINERLTLKVTSIQFDKTPIIDVVRTFSDLSGVPMQLDIDELRARNISIEAPVSLQLQESTIAEMIDAVLQKTRLTRHDGNGWLVLGYTDEQVNALRTVRHDMSRLASLEQNPISAQLAANQLSELLVSQTQNSKAYNAAVAVDGNEIVVVGTYWLQDQAKRLLQSLFYLRGLEPESGMPPERLAPEVFGWDRVNLPLSFNLVEPVPLKQAVQLIESHTKLRILIDHAALCEEGLSQESQVTSRVSNGTIDTVLRGMLEPMGLTYRIVEANAVEITTPRSARQKMTIEAQQYIPLTDGHTPESCAEAIRQAFGGPANWNPDTGGVIVIDPASGYMLVRQSQLQQRDIRLWLGRLHSEPETEDSATTP